MSASSLHVCAYDEYPVYSKRNYSQAQLRQDVFQNNEPFLPNPKAEKNTC